MTATDRATAELVAVVARNLAIDQVTAEVAAALGTDGVPCVLLKGPSTVRWLYPDRPRGYRDADLLVPPSREGAAEQTLDRLGFAPTLGTGVPEPDVARQHGWLREGQRVELHVTLTGVGASPEATWSTLSSTVEPLEVGGRSLSVLAPAARAFHLALHAAQHGRLDSQPQADLALALGNLAEELWHDAARLARELDAEAAFCAGLGLLASGEALLTRLAVARRATVNTELRAASSPPVAQGLERLARASGAAPRLRIVVRTVVPSPTFMRWWSPMARRGRRGLLAAYVMRPFWLIWHAVPGMRAWRRARRRVRRIGTERPVS